MSLTDKRILLGVTGGIAAYKSAELVRLLVKAGADVQVMMTEAATAFIAPLTFQALSGKPVFQDRWDDRVANGMAHIEFTRDVDAMLIAPASADFLAKVANGLADDLLSTACLARECPLLVAPAMNRQMWENPATQRNAALLGHFGVTLLGPAAGEQACGETGLGRMLEPEELLADLEAFFVPKLLAGRRVLLTAGPTFEPIDAVRGITNTSSGKMGYAVARAAAEAGAEVVLVSGPTALPTPRGVTRLDVSSARDMYDTVLARAGAADVFIAVAAVADYRVDNAAEHKIKKSDAALQLTLVPNPDILATVAALPEPPYCVGFAAESQNLAAYASEKRRRKKLPLIVANLAQYAFGRDDNELVLFDDAGEHRLPRMSKRDAARRLIEHIAPQVHCNGCTNHS